MEELLLGLGNILKFLLRARTAIKTINKPIETNIIPIEISNSLV
jgi:hypothetical protein